MNIPSRIPTIILFGGLTILFLISAFYEPIKLMGRYDYVFWADYDLKYPMEISNSGALLDDKENALPDGQFRINSRGGGSALLVSDRVALPSGIRISWNSITEDKTWCGETQFDTSLYKKLKKHSVKAPFSYFQKQNRFMDSLRYGISIHPNGFAVIYMGSYDTDEKFIIGHLWAKSTYKSDNQTATLLEKLNKRGERFQAVIEEIKAGTYPTSDKRWKQLAKYPWEITIKDNFSLDTIKADFVSKESYLMESKKVGEHAVPSLIVASIHNDEGIKRRISFEFNEAKTVKDFETLAQNGDKIDPMILRLIVNSDLSAASAYLYKGENKVKLKMKPHIMPYYVERVCDDPSLEMNASDLADSAIAREGEFNKLFIFKSNGKPIPNCLIPDDHIDPRRSPLFMAKLVLKAMSKRRLV